MQSTNYFNEIQGVSMYTQNEVQLIITEKNLKLLQLSLTYLTNLNLHQLYLKIKVTAPKVLHVFILNISDIYLNNTLILKVNSVS